MEDTKCLVELDEVLGHLNEEELNKIPYKIREGITTNKDKQYCWEYDETKNLNEQNLNRKTIAMLSYLNIKYLLNEQQKELMKSLHKLNEKEKIKKYNYDNLFKNKKSTVSNEMLVPIQKEKWYKKILYFIKKIIKKIKLYYKIKRNKKKHM